MATSYNGWPASPNLKTRVIEPVKGVRLRIVDNDDVAVVFTYLVQQFHKRVDDVTKPHPADDWGFYFRDNRNNPGQLSCHASGTAIDLDATEHPNGVATRKTFTALQIAETHEILRELEGVIRWGGDYTRTADAMHFEIIKGKLAVKLMANKLRKGKVRPRLKVMSANVQIGDWQPDLADIRRVARTEQPDVIALYEATKLFGHLDVPGYTVKQMKPIRKKKGSQPNTAGVAILVRNGLPYESFILWMKRFWRGPKHGLLQDPRLYRWVRVTKGKIKWKVGGFHFPFGEAPQLESIVSVRGFFKGLVPGRPVIAVMDGNMSMARAKRQMADISKAKIAGKGVDYVIYKNCTLVHTTTIPRDPNHDHPWFVWELQK